MNPKKGDCGTCHWFEHNPNVPTVNGIRSGNCCVNPPLLLTGAQEVPGSRIMQQQPQMQQTLLGVRPPTNDDCRCEKWRPVGMLPDLAHPVH